MAVKEQTRGDAYFDTPQNYLWDWARRTGNVANLANYYVETIQNGSTGQVTLYVRDIADLTAISSTDRANPVTGNFSVNDVTVALECQVRGGFGMLSSSAGIGGIAIGAAGTGFYSGYTLSWGDDFKSLDIVGPAKPTGYMTSRGTVSMPGARSAPASAHYYTDPLHTGYLDSGRGVAPITDTISIQGGTRLKLAARIATAGEKAGFAPSSYAGGTPVIAASALMTARKAGFYVGTAGGEIIVEAMIRFSPKASNPAGWHPTFWTLSAAPTVGYTSDEWDIVEGSSQAGYFNSNTWAAGVGNTTGTAGPMDFFDGADHLWTLTMSQTSASVYVDGALQFTRALNTNAKNLPAYVLFTSVVLNGTYNSDTFSQSAWTAAGAAGAAMEIDYLRFWRKSATPHYAPLQSVADVSIAYAGTGSVVLPSTLALWGDAGVTEYVQAIAGEVNDPTADVLFLQFPPGVSFASRTISIDWSASNTAPGRLVFTVEAYKSTGCTFEPLTFCVNRGPVITTTALAWTVGNAVNTDVYALCNVGNLLPKVLSVSGLPSPLSFSAVTGLITGTPVSTSSGNVSVTVTNSAGQQVNSNIAYSVAAAPTGVPAPGGITGTLVASWDPANAATLTLNGSSVTAMSGADGTSITMSNAGTLSTCPTLVARNGTNALRFTAASSQFMQIASSLGITGPCTVIAVIEPATTVAANGMCAFDIANSGYTLSNNRITLLATTATGFSFRKHDPTTSSTASTGSAFTTGMHLWIGRSAGGTGVAARLNMEGTATPIVSGTPTNQPSGLNTTTLGNTKESSASIRWLDGWAYRYWVYATDLSDADIETFAATCATAYGTSNLA